MPYDPALPTTRDRVRRLIGDVAATPVLADGEIDWVIGQYGDLYLAAAECAEILAGHYAPGVQMSVGDQSIDAGARFAHYRTLAKSLRSRAGSFGGADGGGGALPYAGGIAVADKEATELDAAATPPFFRRDDYAAFEEDE
ncbi:MAG: hypothetical protein U0556_09910 [Dehalococcoidia bacterium]